MKKVIIFVEDIRLFVAELLSVFNDSEDERRVMVSVNEETQEPRVAVPFTHSVKNGYGRMWIALCSDQKIDLIDGIANCEMIGEIINGDRIMVDGGEEKYQSVYPTTSREIDDGEGGTFTYTRPDIFGGFA